MTFEYVGAVRAELEACIGDLAEFEDQIRRLSPELEPLRVAVSSLSPGRSGAMVCLVRRLSQGRSLKPLLVKTSRDVSLLIKERDNYNRHVRNHWPRVPQLLDTGSSRLLIYDFEGFLSGLEPTTLKQGYGRSRPSALAELMRKIVSSLQEVHRFQPDVVPFITRLKLPSPLPDRLHDHTALPPELQQRLVQAWEALHADGVARPARYPLQQSTEQHGDLNVGNILFMPGDHASLPLFIDFGMMESGQAKGYDPTGQAPFWDYAKLERDIKTRLFVVDATAEGLDPQAMLQAIGRLDGHSPLSEAPHALPGGQIQSQPESPLAVQRLEACLQALRQAIQACTPPDLYNTCYRISVAFATLCLFYRDDPDDNLDLNLQHRIAAESVLALLSPSTSQPATASATTSSQALASAAPVTLPQGTVSQAVIPNLILRSFAASGPTPANANGWLIDLSNLFQDRLPIHPSVWSDDIPQRLAAALPAIRQLPQPLRTSLYCHLSIAWYVGALLNPKAGFQVEPLQYSQGQLVLWGLGPGQLPPGNEGWRWECVEEGEGSDLAVVISVSKAALADARHAIPNLGLSLAAIHHASVPAPGNEAIVDARHARWLADDLILAIHGLRARLHPQRLHLFPACPVALMLLLGQQAEACGPTTVYEFAYGAPEASYSAGMASGL